MNAQCERTRSCLSFQLGPHRLVLYLVFSGEASDEKYWRDRSGVSPHRYARRQVVDSLSGAHDDLRLAWGDSGQPAGILGARGAPDVAGAYRERILDGSLVRCKKFSCCHHLAALAPPSPLRPRLETRKPGFRRYRRNYNNTVFSGKLGEELTQFGRSRAPKGPDLLERRHSQDSTGEWCAATRALPCVVHTRGRLRVQKILTRPTNRYVFLFIVRVKLSSALLYIREPASDRIHSTHLYSESPHVRTWQFRE